MDTLKDIIQRCHQRREKPFRQKKTTATPALYKHYPFQFKVYCAHRYPVLLNDLEEADISIMPIGRAPDYDRGPRDFGGPRFSKRQGTADWKIRFWQASWGIQVYTGMPSERDDAYWHDIEFKYEALCAAPDTVLACIEALVNTVPNPLLTLSKSGGLRFSCRVPGYLHPSTEEAKQYVYKHKPLPEDPYHREVYLEIFGEEGYSCWDARHEILLGNILDPPLIPQDVLFAPIDILRTVFHEPGPPMANNVKPALTQPPLFDSDNLELAKEAFLKHGFSYTRQENAIYYWTQYAGAGEDVEVLLWEDGGTVWVRASTPHAGFPTNSTPITEIWEDTGILPSVPATGLPISDQTLQVRNGELSPLAIKRLPPMLQKPESTKTADAPLGKNIIQVQDVFDHDTRIFTLTNTTGAATNPQVESYLLSGGEACLSMPDTQLAEAAEKHFQALNLTSVVHWKPRTYLWKQVKDIPVDVRMENPFQHGNVCEDPERCAALQEKGGNPRDSICPECRVYTQCQQRGYLSQFATLQRAKVQIVAIPKLFFDPQYAEVLEEIFQYPNETNRLCIIDTMKAYGSFIGCKLSKDILETWISDWQGSVLGNFAKLLLNNLELKGQPDRDITKRVRTALQAFEQQKDELIRQMCQVNISGKVVPRKVVDAQTGEELARFSIKFHAGSDVYIPINDNAADRLRRQGLPSLSLSSFLPNENIRIPMSLTQAIELRILDITTVENIQKLPTASQNPRWTFWHQLKRFFDHYTRDTDAPMLWDKKVLQFFVPTVLHQSVKRLLLESSISLGPHLHRAFPDENIGDIYTQPAAWIQGNQVFQIRTGTYPLETILDINNSWDVARLSEIGHDFSTRIHAEIQRDPNVKHAIITYRALIQHLKGTLEEKNLCFITDFKDARKFKVAFEEAEVIWIVGMPRWAESITWKRTQRLFGNDEEPLSYQKESESYTYKDQRVQYVHEQDVVGLLTEIIEHLRLDHLSNKKIVLICSLALPGITDRPETLLFDWEDFEIAGGLHKLTETIRTRERYEAQRDNLTAESSRETVERVLGCSTRQANRVLNKLRGGNIQRVPFREQILVLLSDGEKKAVELVAAIEGHPKSIYKELIRLVDTSEIVRVRWGVYALPKK